MGPVRAECYVVQRRTKTAQMWRAEAEATIGLPPYQRSESMPTWCQNACALVATTDLALRACSGVPQMLPRKPLKAISSGMILVSSSIDWRSRSLTKELPHRLNCTVQPGDDMCAYYLLKTEPSDYSFEDLARDRETVWDGVANPAALKHLRAMKPGDRLVIYETANVRSAVGTARVRSVHGAQGEEPDVTVKVMQRLPRMVRLAEIKVSTLFRDSPLVRQGRLSVVPLSEQQYHFLTGG